MNGTTRAGRFCLTIAAVVQTAVGIVQQAKAVWTERVLRVCIAVLIATIQVYHKCYCALLGGYSGHYVMDNG